jgi:hypothetical protein
MLTRLLATHKGLVYVAFVVHTSVPSEWLIVVANQHVTLVADITCYLIGTWR